MAVERDLDQQRIADAERSADAVARDAQGRIQVYQQQLRAGLLTRSGDPRSARARGWRAVLAPLRATWRILSWLTA